MADQEGSGSHPIRFVVFWLVKLGLTGLLVTLWVEKGFPILETMFGGAAEGSSIDSFLSGGWGSGWLTKLVCVLTFVMSGLIALLVASIVNGIGTLLGWRKEGFTAPVD